MIMIANLQYAWTLFVKPMQAAHRLEAVRHPVGVHAVHPVPDLGAAARRMADRSAGAARVHQRRRRAVRPRLGRPRLRDVAADALHAVLCWPASARRSSTAAASGRRSSGSRSERGLAAGIMAAGFGGGTALFIPFIASIIQTQRLPDGVHLRPASFRASMILIVAQFLRHPPAEAASAPSRGGAARKLGQAPVHDAARCCGRRSSTCCTRCS